MSLMLLSVALGRRELQQYAKLTHVLAQEHLNSCVKAGAGIERSGFADSEPNSSSCAALVVQLLHRLVGLSFYGLTSAHRPTHHGTHDPTSPSTRASNLPRRSDEAATLATGESKLLHFTTSATAQKLLEAVEGVVQYVLDHNSVR